MKRVEVAWTDSEGTPGWQNLRDAQREAEEPLLLHHSCGYLVGDTDDAVTVALSYRPAVNDWLPMVSGTIKIPRRCVVTVTPLAG